MIVAMANILCHSLLNRSLTWMGTIVFPRSALHTTAPVCKMEHRMRKDHKRRMLTAQYYPQRLSLNLIRKNNILPDAIKEIADKEVAALPIDSNRNRLTDRCIVTSRPRGNQRLWRLSRIVWRHHADYNKLSGVQRACW